MELYWQQMQLTEEIMRRLPCRLIGVEGGVGNVSLTEYRVGTIEKREEVAAELFMDGKLSEEE